MAEILEQIKNLSVEEKYALADQILVMADEERGIAEDEEWKAELVRRALHAKENGFPGRSLDEVLDELEADRERQVASP